MENKESICWIDTVSYEQAGAPLQAIYDSVRGPAGTLDNLYRSFSLRPHTIKPADDLYRAALHDPGNSLAKHFAELLGCYVALLNGCDYALTHHGHNFAHLLGDRQRAEQILQSLRDGCADNCGTPREVAALRYTEKLCRAPQDLSAEDISVLRASGWEDGEILEIVQIVAMFSYFVRVINGVGISTRGEKIGFY